jgi:hypothetical protein
MSSDNKQLRLAARHLKLLARDLKIANAVLDEWDQNRTPTKVSQPTNAACRRETIAWTPKRPLSSY